MQLQVVDALGDGGVRPRQEARAHAKGDLAEPQVEARGLDLVLHEFVFGEDRAVADQRADHLVGQDAPLIHCKGERHVRASSGLIRRRQRYPMTVLTGRLGARYTTIIPWSI